MCSKFEISKYITESCQLTTNKAINHYLQTYTISGLFSAYGKSYFLLIIETNLFITKHWHKVENAADWVFI